MTILLCVALVLVALFKRFAAAFKSNMEVLQIIAHIEKGNTWAEKGTLRKRTFTSKGLHFINAGMCALERNAVC